MISYHLAVIAAALSLPVVLFWFWVFYRSKKKITLSKKILLGNLFIVGVLTTIPSILIEMAVIELPNQNIFSQCLAGFCQEKTTLGMIILILVVFFIALVEEFSKYFGFKFIAYQNPNFTKVADGILFGIIIALGFATLENANYFLKIISEKNYLTLLPVMLLRFTISTSGHIVYTGTLGYFLGLARFNPIKEKLLIRKGLILAVGIHALFNFLLFTKVVIYLIPLVLFLLWWLWKKINSLQKDKYLCNPFKIQL